MTKKAMLVILDGWGHGQIPEADAILQADTPYMDSLYQNWPNAELITFGEEVGLPKGQMGNSEVGHLNLGAGRVVYQDLAKINKAIADNTFVKDEAFQKAIELSKTRNSKFHILGLVSDGGVHSHIDHLKAVISYLDHEQLENVYIHAFLDGRDTDPKSGIGFLAELSEHLEHNKNAAIATIIGRYYAMDRDHRWERTGLAYNLLVQGQGARINDWKEAIRAEYEAGITDEFMPPMLLEQNAQIEDGDVVLFVNFRSDRPRQLSYVLTQEPIADPPMSPLDIAFFTMTEYDETYEKVEVLFQKEEIKNTLGQYLSNKKISQLRAAETEKYPHVTFFFNGGEEAPGVLESRLLVPSPKVATYDLQPEMSAVQLTDELIAKIKSDSPHFVCVNYANTDMVGHTGVFSAVMKSATTVDQCLSQLIPVAISQHYGILIIADHGNGDYMINTDGSPHTAHTINPVPIIAINTNASQVKNGKLADIAPTILNMMGIEIPKEMTGECLLD